MNPVVVLGATGSIGSQALEVAAELGIPVVGLAAGRASRALASIAARHPEAAVAAAEPGDGLDELGDRVALGSETVTALASMPGTTVVNGIVGLAGLRPTLAALEAGNRLALANKESLVAAGPLVVAARRRGGGELLPVDSEHSAIFQCLVGEDPATVRRLLLTASGGPFRGRRREQLAAVTVEEALAHPTWAMGPRVTIDSATLMNKALEVVEAHALFGVDLDRIEVVVHPQSFVHSLVEFVDGVTKAELGPPDMRKPIRYALTAPGRRPGSHPPLDLVGRELSFEEPDRVTFPALDLGYEAARRGGTAPAILNAADEVAVAAFLEERLGFLDIAETVAATLEAAASVPVADLETVLAADAEARAVAADEVRRRGQR